MAKAAPASAPSSAEREHLLRHGFVVIRGLLTQGYLENLRTLTEALVEQHKELLGVHGEHRPGCFAGTMSPYVEPMAAAVGSETAPWVELWSSPRSPLHALSSRLLGVHDAALASMEALCQDPPHNAGHTLAGGRLSDAPSAPGLWHRDFYPSRCAPLESWAADAAENGGPTYIQWNIPLYDDDVLQVVPNSHFCAADPEQDASLRSNGLGSSGRGAFAGMLPRAIPVALKAGDGVAYINQLIHRASHYRGNSSPDEYGHSHRRTLHGGYFAAAGYPWTTPFLPHLTPASQAAFTRWSLRHNANLAQQEATLRAVIDGSPQDYRRQLKGAVAGHSGPAGCRHSAILLSKAARRLFFYQHPELDRNTQQQPGTPGGEWTDHFDARALQDPALWPRFTRAEAGVLWARMRHIDAAMQAPEPGGSDWPDGSLNWAPAFQGGPTTYRFHGCPDVAQFQPGGRLEPSFSDCAAAARL